MGEGPATAGLAGVELQLVVVGDSEMAETAGKLQGEWQALTRSADAPTGCRLQVRSITEDELLAAEVMPGDAVICPSCLLGPLAERKLITPLPKQLLRDKGNDWGEVFELLRLSETTWGAEVEAVAFGSPVLTCYYRADLLEKLGRTPPRTWKEYHELARLLADRGNLAPDADENAAWSGTIEPLGPGWAAVVLLARSAAYAKHRDNYSTLFDIRTMEPLLSGPPFVRALEELVAVAKLGTADQMQYDPAAARAAFWRGESGMTLSWPSAAGGLPDDANQSIQVGFAELPGSIDVYDVGNQIWDRRNEDQEERVPLLGIAGRIGVVSAKSDHTLAAFQLLFWLSGGQSATKLCASSPATTLFRRSHVKSPSAWVEKPISTLSATQYGEVTAATFRRQQWISCLRIPGRSEYVATLDEAVRQAFRGERSVAEALQQAGDRWKEITERLGAEKQKMAYLHSLGLE